MQASQRILPWFAVTAVCCATLAGIFFKMSEPAKGTAPLAVPTVQESDLVPEVGTLKPASTLAEAQKTSPTATREQQIMERLRMQHPMLMLPDVGSAELQRTHHVPWGATDPDAFWHSQMLKVKDAARDGGLEHVPLRLKQ